MTVNCCNGRVGRREMEMAAKDEKFRQFAMPTGVEIIKAISAAGGDVTEAVNCCNGRVGRQLASREIAEALAGAAD